jgi:UDP-N-acetylglucosamine 2-epimerase (non-hydrolysing)
MNRRIIDHCSDVLLPYTERSRTNLMQEGIPNKYIYVTGNPILEVIHHYQDSINQSKILEHLTIEKKNYFLVTLHRAENVDIETRLREFIKAFTSLSRHYAIPVICSLHPRTRDKIKHFNIPMDPAAIQFHEPFGFFDFIRLEQEAKCVISDSGTVQEECCLFHVPNITIRDVTERPETVDCGSNILSGSDHDTILRCVQIVLSQPPEWVVPPEYLIENVSTTIVKILLGLHRREI